MSNFTDLSDFIWPDAAMGRQPQGAGYAVDPANPLSRGALSFFNAATPTVNFVNGQAFSGAGAGTSPAVTKAGIGVSFTGAGAGKYQSAITEGSQITIIVLAAMTRSTQNARLFSTFNGTGVGKFDFFYNTGTPPAFQVFRGTTNGSFSPGSAAWYDGKLHVFAITYDESSNSNVPAFYVDNVLDTTTTNTAPVGSVVTASNLLAWGGRPDVTTRQAAGTIVGGVAFGRLLSAAEIALESANLWQILAPQTPIPFTMGGGTTPTATLAWTEADDTTAITGTLTVSGTLAWTEADDTTAITATVGSVSGTLAWTEANDVASIAATLTVSGAASWTEANDTAALTGSVFNAASLAWTEADDTLSITGTVTAAGTVAASLAWTEADDTLVMTGQVQSDQPFHPVVGQGSLPGWTPYEPDRSGLTEDDIMELFGCFLEVM